MPQWFMSQVHELFEKQVHYITNPFIHAYAFIDSCSHSFTVACYKKILRALTGIWLRVSCETRLAVPPAYICGHWSFHSPYYHRAHWSHMQTCAKRAFKCQASMCSIKCGTTCCVFFQRLDDTYVFYDCLHSARSKKLLDYVALGAIQLPMSSSASVLSCTPSLQPSGPS